MVCYINALKPRPASLLTPRRAGCQAGPPGDGPAGGRGALAWRRQGETSGRRTGTGSTRMAPDAPGPEESGMTAPCPQEGHAAERAGCRGVNVYNPSSGCVCVHSCGVGGCLCTPGCVCAHTICVCVGTCKHPGGGCVGVCTRPGGLPFLRAPHWRISPLAQRSGRDKRAPFLAAAPSFDERCPSPRGEEPGRGPHRRAGPCQRLASA